MEQSLRRAKATKLGIPALQLVFNKSYRVITRNDHHIAQLAVTLHRVAAFV